MKKRIFLSAIVFLLATQLKSQKKDSIPNYKKNEIGINITSPVALILTGGSSSVPNLMELNYKRGFKPNIYGRINLACRLAFDKNDRIVNMENAYGVERIRYKDNYNYYKTENLYNEIGLLGSIGIEKRWRVGKMISPVLAIDIVAGKISGRVNTYEQIVSDSTFSSSMPTKPKYNYNNNYSLGNEIYVQKFQSWLIGTDISYGALINISKKFCLSGQLVGNFSLITSKMQERDLVVQSEFSPPVVSTFDFKLRGNLNLYYKF